MFEAVQRGATKLVYGIKKKILHNEDRLKKMNLMRLDKRETEMTSQKRLRLYSGSLIAILVLHDLFLNLMKVVEDGQQAI